MRFRRWCRKCDCEQEIRPIMGYWDHWRKLFWLLEFLRLENTIEEATYNEYIESLMFFKRLAEEAEELVQRLEALKDDGQ